MSSSLPAHHRQQVLALFRGFLREAKIMPTIQRQEYVRNKVRHEFKQSKDMSPGEELDFLVSFAHTQLENVQIQQQHLNVLKREGKLKC